MLRERTSLFLAANLGSEVTRFVGAFEAGDRELLQSAYVRAVRILDELGAREDMNLREREMLILRDVLRDMATGGGKSHVTPRFLKEYFLPFAKRLMAA